MLRGNSMLNAGFYIFSPGAFLSSIHVMPRGYQVSVGEIINPFSGWHTSLHFTMCGWLAVEVSHMQLALGLQ